MNAETHTDVLILNQHGAELIEQLIGLSPADCRVLCGRSNRLEVARHDAELRIVHRFAPELGVGLPRVCLTSSSGETLAQTRRAAQDAEAPVAAKHLLRAVLKQARSGPSDCTCHIEDDRLEVSIPADATAAAVIAAAACAEDAARAAMWCVRTSQLRSRMCAVWKAAAAALGAECDPVTPCLTLLRSRAWIVACPETGNADAPAGVVVRVDGAIAASVAGFDVTADHLVDLIDQGFASRTVVAYR